LGGIDEVVHPNLLWFAARLPLASPVLVATDLLLGVHRDHRLAGPKMSSSLAVEVPELPITSGMLGALDGLGGGLEAVAELAQQLGDRDVADRMALLSQGCRQLTRALGDPAQR
jgi:hypothetical protein